MSMVTRPAEGMAAAPIAASVAVHAITNSCGKPIDTPCACESTMLGASPSQSETPDVAAENLAQHMHAVRALKR